MTRRDDPRPGSALADEPIPAPDDEPTAAEQARARAFGDLIDRAVSGRDMPAAMSADDRALLEVATVIRGASGKLELDGDRTSSLIDAALAHATDKNRPKSASLPPPLGAPAAPIPIGRARRAWLPWSVAAVAGAVATAAIAMLLVRAPRAPAARPRLPETQRSRAADELVGEITRERSGDALERIDAIYADRLDGYRELALAGNADNKGSAR
jgi:hypothetical protein